MPVSCHFRDCKALLVAILTHVRGAVASTRPLPLSVGGRACYCVSAMPVLFKPPSVQTSPDGRYLQVEWPAWLSNVTGNGTGPVVSYTLQGLARLSGAASNIWQNLIVIRHRQPSTSVGQHPSTDARQFTYLAEGRFGLVPLISMLM